MDQEKDTLPVRAHLAADVEIPTRALALPDGRYAIRFGWDFSLHVTPEQWDAIDAAARTAFGAAVAL
jgi:hypothetical protein